MTKKPELLHQAKAHQLDAFQIDEIVKLLALTFEQGSGLSQICNAKGEELRRRLCFLFHTLLTMPGDGNQQVLSVKKNAQLIGVAVIQEPNSHFPLWSQIQGLLRVCLAISPKVAWHLWQNVKILEQHHPLEPHYYLLFLGVHPNFQKQGYARILLDTLHALSEAHPCSTGVYLETANPQNVNLYQHFGYHITAQVNIKGVETFSLFRANSLKASEY